MQIAYQMHITCKGVQEQNIVHNTYACMPMLLSVTMVESKDGEADDETIIVFEGAVSDMQELANAVQRNLASFHN